MDNFVAQEKSDFKNIFNRFKKRNFSGDTGQAIKNSSYQLTTNIVMKVGSLLFTIIVARMLLPELFGLYSLALSTIIFFSAFSDLGIGTALITFISKTASRGNNKKAKAYFNKLLRWKIYLILVTSLALLISSYYIANNFYQKPIFYALLAGGLYIPLVSLIGFISSVFVAKNDFKAPFVKEMIFQILRLILVPLVIFYFLKMGFSNEAFITSIVLSLVVCYTISGSILFFRAKRKITFLKSNESKLNKSETKDLKKFILPLTATVLSGVFFGYIDTLMLGKFVSGSYIAYYGAAFSLIGSAFTIIGFTSSALFPLFSKLKGKQLENLFRKSFNFTLIFSMFAFLFTFLLSKYIIGIIYGAEYISSIGILKYFSFLLVIAPLSSLYDKYFISNKKTNLVAKVLVFTTIVNILLNYFGITFGLRFSEFHAVLGATIATILSRFLYFGIMFFYKKKLLKGDNF